MTKIVTSLLAGTAILGLSAVAQAADMGAPFRSPTVIPVADSPSANGWYLRGDMGIGLNHLPTFDSTGSAGMNANPNSSWISRDIADTPFIGAGVGYQFNDYLRGDLTAEYRAATRFRAIGSYPRSATDTAYPFNDGVNSSAVVLANAYVDLGTYHGLTPYVGAGIGAAYNKTGDVYQHTTFPAFGTIADGVFPGEGKWNLAWALHTGVTWDVNSRLKLDMGYSYKSLGTAKTGELICNESPNVNRHCNEWLSLKNLGTSDLRFGMRWLLDPKDPRTPVYASAPVVAKY